jgi:hypothetical protein
MDNWRLTSLTSGQAHAAQLFSHAIGNWVFTQLKGSEGLVTLESFIGFSRAPQLWKWWLVCVFLYMSVIFKTSENKTSSSTDPDKFLEKYLHIYKQAVALLERLLL